MERIPNLKKFNQGDRKLKIRLQEKKKRACGGYHHACLHLEAYVFGLTQENGAHWRQGCSERYTDSRQILFHIFDIKLPEINLLQDRKEQIL